MTAYYNEIDPSAAAWLRELIKAGHIADGVVDTRSIEDVCPKDLAGFSQCHFFAGIGGWSYALRLAGWDDARPVWTGSCPCQPFSAAGKGGGFADERHLWPAFFHLIEQRRPPVVFGEQVASADGLGWLDLVRADLEAAGYACGAADLCAAGVGAPHIRQRLYWCGVGQADSSGARLEGRNSGEMGDERATTQRGGGADGLADLHGSGRAPWGEGCTPMGYGPAARADRCPNAGGPANAPNGFWRAADWLACRDGKWRPAEPGTFPLAHGIPARVGRLRGYGNAIVPQAAAAFVRAAA